MRDKALVLSSSALTIRLKRALGRMARARRVRPIRKLVLLYHSVGSGPWAIPEETFASQLRWLSQAAELSPLERLIEDDGTESLQVAITFDDGYASLRDTALPILRDVGAVATVFLNTGQIGECEVRGASDPSLGYYPKEHFLSHRDVLALAAAGWSIGSHGVGHIDLTRAAGDQTREELHRSRRAIEALLSVPCTLFAYTWGRHDQELRDMVAKAGYRYAFSGHHGPLHPDSDCWALPRINVAREYTLSDFHAIVRGDWDYVGWIQSMKARF
jgi:peptidoglycan/xylan/chitin deacetylase (PgdA/CDA1 family)